MFKNFKSDFLVVDKGVILSKISSIQLKDITKYKKLLSLEIKVEKINQALNVLYKPFQSDKFPEGWPCMYLEDLPVLFPSDNVVKKGDLDKIPSNKSKMTTVQILGNQKLGGKKKKYKKRLLKKCQFCSIHQKRDSIFSKSLLS